MGFRGFIIQQLCALFFVARTAKADTVCRGSCFFFQTGLLFPVVARDFSELGDFYYFFVVGNHNLPANRRQLAASCSLSATFAR